MRENSQLILLLEEYGKWRATGMPGLDYPAETVESRLMTFGIQRTGQSNKPLTANGKQSKGFLSGRVPDHGKSFRDAHELSALHRIVEYDLPPPQRMLLWIQYVGEDGYGLKAPGTWEYFDISKRAYHERLSRIHTKLEELFWPRKKRN